MASTGDQDDKSRPTVAGCLLLVLSVAVIFGLAVPIVRWRDRESGDPLPRDVAIVAPILAGALFYAIGSAILRIFGLSVLTEPEEDDPPERPDDVGGPPTDHPT
jgi:hypothetical protein